MTKRVRAAVIALILSTLGVLLVGAGAPAASAAVIPAGPGCDAGCSQTYNQSAYGVYAAHDWCDSGSYHGPCVDHGTYHNSYMWIPAGGHTPLNQDWDTFRIDAGWCYRITITYAYGLYSEDFTYDQRGKGEVWIPIHNDETGIVRFQSTSSC